MSERLDRARAIMDADTEDTMRTAAAVNAVHNHIAILAAIRALKEAGQHQQAEVLERQVSAAPITLLALPQPSTNGAPQLPPQLPAPKKRGRPRKESAADVESSGSESEP